MSTLVRKALRDLGEERFRSASIALSLALGVAGFFAVLSSYAVLTRALNDGYLATHPPSATLAVDRLDDALVRAARDTPGVDDAEPRRTLRGRIRSGPTRWRNLVLFARDFAGSRIGAVAPETGAWPPGPGELAIERDAVGVAGARVGDAVTVRTESGREASLRVTGSVHDVGQAQARMENLVYGYVALETLAELGESPFYDELAIRVAERPNDAAHVRAVAESLGAALQRGGARVARIDVPQPGQHPHAKLMGLLLLSMAVFGLLVLALASTIVFNVLTALLAAQTRQIGVMKALGGTRAQIASVYLLEAGLLGFAGVVLAVPVGLAGSHWLCAWLASLLNFDVESFATPAWVYLLAVSVGVGVPVLAAVTPVWLRTRVPAREALAPAGRPGRTFGASPVDRALTRVGGLSRTLLLALRNVGRNRLRAALTLATLGAAGVFFMSALNLRQALAASIDRLFAAQRADLSLRLASDYAARDVEAAARETAGVTAAEGWRVIDGELAGAVTASITGLPERSTLLELELASGSGLEGRADRVVVNTELFERLGRPALGAEIGLRADGLAAALRLAGVAREPYSPPRAYVALALLRPRTANQLRVTLSGRDPVGLESAAAALDASLSRRGIRMLQATTKAETRFVFDEHMLMIYVFLIVVSCILGGVGALGLVTSVGLNVSERRRELGVLRALGATPARVTRLVVAEGVFVGLLAWAAALALALPLGKWLGDFLLGAMFRAQSDLAVALEPAGVAAWLALSVFGSALASLLPARRAARMSVRDALTCE